MRHTLAVLATAAVATVVVVPGGATPVAAAPGDLPNLSASFAGGGTVAVAPNGVKPLIDLYNTGSVAATDLFLTFDLSGLSDDVTVASGDQTCTRTGTLLRCTFGEEFQAYGATADRPVRLTSRKGARPGPAGRLGLEFTAAEADADPRDNRTAVDVVIGARGPDVTAVVPPVGSAAAPAAPGEQLFHVTLKNNGDVEATTTALVLRMPEGVALWDPGLGCDSRLGTDGNQFDRRPVRCLYEAYIPPGAEWEVDEIAGSWPRLRAMVGVNAAGPAELQGRIEVQVAGGDPRPADNRVPFSVWTQPNQLDLAVSVQPLRRGAGRTAELTWTVTNHGPSDATGPIVDVVAPAGARLRAARGCTTPDAGRTLSCRSGDWFPPTASGHGTVTRTVLLNVGEGPLTGGSVTVRNAGPSAESDPSDNTAPVVASGGAGGGLPVSGPG